MQIPFQLLSPRAKAPTQGRPGDAGYDLYNAADGHTILRPGERSLFATNIAVAIPPGYYGRIADRSGNALKRGLHVLGGVVDSAYRGNVGVILLNTNGGGEDGDIIRIDPGERIAQLIIERCHEVTFEQVETLPETERGGGGFGSTGA